MIALAFVSALLLGISACGSSSDTTSEAVTVSGNTAQIKMQNTKFSPDDLTVDKGATVTWSNEDSTTHTVTAGNGAFNSGNLAPGKNFGYTFNETGTFDYSCTIHPGMKGKVTVK